MSKEMDHTVHLLSVNVFRQHVSHFATHLKTSKKFKKNRRVDKFYLDIFGKKMGRLTKLCRTMACPYTPGYSWNEIQQNGAYEQGLTLVLYIDTNEIISMC